MARPTPTGGVVSRRKKSDKPLLDLDGLWDRQAVMRVLAGRMAVSGDSVGTLLRQGYEGYDLPSAGAVAHWIATDPAVEAVYLSGKRMQAEYLASQLVEIADDLSDEDVARLRLRIDTRKWVAAKLLPQRYGDKVAVSGDPEGAPIQAAIEVVFK